jgi:adenylate cyclase
MGGPKGGPRKRKSRAKPKAAKRKTTELLSNVVSGLASSEPDTVARVRSVAEALDLDKVVEFLDSDADIVAAVRQLLSRGENRYTMAEAAAKSGLSVEQIAQLNLASGFANPEHDAAVFTDEDIEILQLFQATTEFFGEDLALQNIRVIGSAMSRVADAFISTFVVMIGRQSAEGEFGEAELTQANELAVGMLPGAVKAMDVLLRRHIELKSRTDFALGADWEGVDAIDRAIGFCDLVGYTRLSQQISDTRLATMLRAFESTASDLITACGASVVKLIGDEVMFVAPDAATGAEVALSLSESFGKGDVLPPVRCGLASGRVILREGDYHGPVVNLAARIVKLAEPGTALVSAETAAAIGESYNAQDEGLRDLKGFDEPVHVFRLTR